MKKIIYLLILFNFTVFAQIKMNMPSVDKETYKLFLAKDWNNLIKTGKTALNNGIDFYYLNYRMGIAYYEKSNYAKATQYFKKVYKANQNDDTVKEYLYFSYLLSGRYDDARLFGSYFSDKMKTRLGIKLTNPFISAVQLTGKIDMVEDYAYTPKLNENLDQSIVEKQTWYSFGTEHLINNKTTLMYSFSKTNIENNVYSTDADLPENYTENINQKQYYISLKQHFGNGFNASVGMHYLNTEFYAPTTEERVGFGGQRSFNLYSYNERTFVGSVNLNKSFSIFNTSLETSFSNINNKTQIQPSLSLRIYPFGNNKFYSETKGIYISEKDGANTTNYSVLKQSFGFVIKKYSFISPSVTYGELINFTDFNGYIVNNDVDKLKFRFENYINLGFKKGTFNVFANYRYNVKEATYTVDDIDKKTEYNSQNIFLGVKMYF